MIVSPDVSSKKAKNLLFQSERSIYILTGALSNPDPFIETRESCESQQPPLGSSHMLIKAHKRIERKHLFQQFLQIPPNILLLA